VIDLDDLLRLPGLPLAEVVTLTGAEGAERERVKRYENLKKPDVIDAPGGIRIVVLGDEVALVYVGSVAVPAGLGSDELRDAVGSDGELLRSRQGKAATLHVVADRGVAWSEEQDEIGFIELFPPTTLHDYRTRIYREPPAFRR
jgi:hypothetical protein